jgi:N-methylhydantoinase A
MAKGGFAGAFLVVQSTGGLFEVAQARKQCVRMLESGPASGVIATQALCREAGVANAIAFDMGGTTAKAGVIKDGHVLTTGSALVGGYEKALPIQLPMIDIFEVGAGGGSIARLADGGALHVGPQSAGAVPGPACYGQGGTEPTVTDANLVLGRLGAASFLGGEMRLDVRAAEKALYARIAGPLGMSTIEAAQGILDIAVTKMAHAVKAVTTARGLDAGNFVLVAYGGAGPLHATQVARELGIAFVLVPRAPGHFSACGMLFSDLRYDYVHTEFAKLAELDFERYENVFEMLEAQGREAVAKARVPVREIRVSRALDMRYVGQEHLVTVDVPVVHFTQGNRAAIKALFDREHEFRYGTFAANEPTEIASLRTTVTGLLAKPKFERVREGKAMLPSEAARGSRPGYFRGRFVETPVFTRDALLSGNRIEGPALVEEHASTTVLMPGDALSVDGLGNLVVQVGPL